MDIRKYLKHKREDNGGGDAVTNTSTACLDRSSHSDQTQDSDQTNESGGPSGSGCYSDSCHTRNHVRKSGGDASGWS